MRLLSLLCFLPSVCWAAFVPAYTIINDSQDYEVFDNGGYRSTYERKIQIETPQGVELYGQAKLGFDGKRDKQEVVEAYTLTAKGQKIPVSPDRIKIVNSNTDDTSPYFSDQKTTIIIFPQVEVSSQLYFKVVTTKEEPALKGYFADSTFFTPHRRYRDASVRVVHPPKTEMQVYARGITGNKSVLSDGRIEHIYRYKQDTAYPLEPDQIDYADFAPGVQFSSFASYADLASVTQSLFQPKTQVTPTIQKLAKDLTTKSDTQAQKAQKLYDWVSRNIRYVGIDVGASGYEPHFADDILANRYGDCKDHTTLLESLLLAVGIKSTPALIKVSNSYELPRLAGNNYFDHVITYVPELDLFLDSTAQFAEFGTLPAADMGKPTLLTSSGVVKHTPLSLSENDFTIVDTKLRLKRNGKIEGKTEYHPHGKYSVDSRSNQFAYENIDTQTIVDAFLSRYQETGTGKLQHNNPLTLNEPWFIKSTYELDPIINVPGPSALMMPTGIAPGFIKQISNNKPYQGRRFPYTCESYSHEENIEFTFDDGIAIERIPKGVEENLEDRTYKSSFRLSGKTLFIKRQVQKNLTSNVCIPGNEQFHLENQFLNTIKSDMRQQIFIK